MQETRPPNFCCLLAQFSQASSSPTELHTLRPVWKIGLRMLTACSFCSPKLAEAALAPRIPHSNTSIPQGHHCLVVPDDSSPWALLPLRYLQLATQCQEPPPHIQVNHRLQALLICCYQDTSLLTDHRGPELPTISDIKRAFATQPKSKNATFPTEGRKAKTCYNPGNTRSSVPPRHTEAQDFILHLPAGQLYLSCPRVVIPAPSLNGNPLHCWC
jgi:hypothetical protein